MSLTLDRTAEKRPTSARTVEPADLRLLAMMDRDGHPRDYYEHRAEEERLERV